MLEIMSEGDKPIYEFIDLFGEAITISFSLYFVCYLRFHVIYPNLDNADSIFFSMFASLPSKFDHQLSIVEKVQHLNKSDETEKLLATVEYEDHFNQLLEQSNSSLNSSNESDPGLFEDRKEYEKLQLINRRATSGVAKYAGKKGSSI